MSSTNEEIARLFERLAVLMELRGENVFKVAAFNKVARILSESGLDLRARMDQGTLGDIEGVGESSRKIIEDYLRTGKSSDLAELSKGVPEGLFPMLRIPGMGPKTVALLWKQRNITSLDELKKAIETGALAGLKGMGEKKIESIKQGIELASAAAGRLGIGEALPIAQGLLAQVRQMPQVKSAEIAGSLRRWRETVGDIDLVCALKSDGDGEEVTAAFVKFPQVRRVLGQGNTKASAIVGENLQVDLRIVPADCFGAALLYFTGSKDHNVKLRGMAQDRDMTLNEWGLYGIKAYENATKKPGEAPRLKSVAGKTETEIYEKLGLPYIEPELREDRGEIEAAADGRLPELLELSDIHGDLHTHTTASDGKASIEQMAQAAIARGYKFLGITDHSKSQVIANGLSAERLLAHVKNIRKIGERYKKQIRLLAGCEVDILIDGRLDFEDAVLAELDFVVASPHISLKQDATKATDRLRRAIEHPYVNIIGHPTGRLINGRAGLPLELDKLFPIAARNGTAMEINAAYPRLDLNDLNARLAMQAGVMLSINTDAHSTTGLEEMNVGVHVARRAWASADNIINCMTPAGLEKFFARKRS